jgi:hypothetical protein
VIPHDPCFSLRAGAGKLPVDKNLSFISPPASQHTCPPPLSTVSSCLRTYLRFSLADSSNSLYFSFLGFSSTFRIFLQATSFGHRTRSISVTGLDVFEPQFPIPYLSAKLSAVNLTVARLHLHLRLTNLDSSVS